MLNKSESAAKTIIFAVFVCFIATSMLLPDSVNAHTAVLKKKYCHTARGQSRHCHSEWKETQPKDAGYVKYGIELDTKEAISLVQKHLFVLGYYTGEINGVAKESTVDAVKRYQVDSGEIVDGKITRPLIVNLAVSVSDKIEKANKLLERNASELKTIK